MKKDKLLQVRVSDDDMDMVRQLAEADRRSVSSYVRWLIGLAVERKIVLQDSIKLN